MTTATLVSIESTRLADLEAVVERHLVEVERRGELPDEAVGSRGVLGGLDRIGQIPHGFVHSGGHPGDGVRNLGVG